MEEFEKVEKAEKEEAEAEILKGKKPALLKGRSKATKGIKMEVMPSPHGIRVKPRTDLLKPVGGEKKAKKIKQEDPTVRKLDSYLVSADKEKPKKPVTKKLGMDIDDDVDKPLTLAERLSLKKEMAAQSKVKPGTKQTKLNFKPKAATKTKKKNPWVTDSEDEDSGGGIVISSSDEEDFKPKKKTTGRGKPVASDSSEGEYATEKKKKSNWSDSESDEVANVKKVDSKSSKDSQSDSDDSLRIRKKKTSKKVTDDLDDIDRMDDSPKKADLTWEEIMDLKPPSPVAKKQTAKRKKVVDNTSDENSAKSSKPAKKQPKKAEKKVKPNSPKKTAKKTKKKNAWESNSDASDDGDCSDEMEIESAPVSRATSRRGATTQKKKYVFSDSGSDDDSD